MTDAKRLDAPGFELLFRFGDANAPRRCSACGDDARYYVLDTDADVSRYVCVEHVDGAVRDAGGDPVEVSLDDSHQRQLGNGRPRRDGE